MMQYMCHFCGTANPELGLFSMGTTCSKQQTTFLHRQTRTERTGQYKGKGLGCSRTGVQAACEGSPTVLWGREDRKQDNKNRKVPPHFMNTVVYSVSRYFPSACGNQDVNCLHCFLFCFFLCPPCFGKHVHFRGILCFWQRPAEVLLLIKPLRELHSMCCSSVFSH